jgi:hypothetical protein
MLMNFKIQAAQGFARLSLTLNGALASDGVGLGMRRGTMTRKMLALFAACSLVLTSVALAQDGTLGVYLDTAGTVCDGTTGGSTLDGSIWVNLSGATATGIVGAEFRVDNTFANDYLIAVTPNPNSNVTFGNPFNTLGANIVFPGCQTGTAGRVELYTFTVIELTNPAPEDAWLTVRSHFNNSNANFDCPLVNLCDDPVFTTVCLGARDSDHWRAVVNPSLGTQGDCTAVAVEEATWSSVKGMFQN